MMARHSKFIVIKVAERLLISDLFHFEAFFRFVDSWVFNIQISWQAIFSLAGTTTNLLVITTSDGTIIFHVIFDT